MAARRVAAASVVAKPVARTATTVAAAAVVAHGVERRTERHDDCRDRRR